MVQPLRDLRLELAIPVEIVGPAFVQVAARELPAILVKFKYGRLARWIEGLHLGVAWHAPAFGEIAGRAGCHDIFPRRASALRAGDDVIKRQVLASAAVLALEPVAQKHIEPREGWLAWRLDESLERDDGRNLERSRRCSHDLIVLLNDIDPVEEDVLKRFLPRADRQWIIGKRPIVRIEDERRAGIEMSNACRLHYAALHVRVEACCLSVTPLGIDLPTP